MLAQCAGAGVKFNQDCELNFFLSIGVWHEKDSYSYKDNAKKWNNLTSFVKRHKWISKNHKNWQWRCYLAWARAPHSVPVAPLDNLSKCTAKSVHLILLIKKQTQYHDSNCEVFRCTFRNYWYSDQKRQHKVLCIIFGPRPHGLEKIRVIITFDCFS